MATSTRHSFILTVKIVVWIVEMEKVDETPEDVEGR